MVEDHVDHLGEIFVEHRHRLARAQQLGDGGESAHVGEQDRDLLVLADQFVLAGREQLVGDLSYM